jgi:two-component system chemotaxis response regulator CheY
MRILIAEDDCASARYMSGLLARFGECVLAEDGELALAAYCLALEEGRPFQLLCLDIMMPRRTGRRCLRRSAGWSGWPGEAGPGCQDHHDQALGDMRSVMSAYRGGATAYITKPILTERLYETICSLGFEV